MRTVVCVKQVPDSTVVRFDIRTNSLVDINYILDPIDAVALSEAIGIREKNGGEVTAITLGPPPAEEVLRTCLKMGVDQAIHLCDQAFANLDVHSTSAILAKQLSKVQYDLIMCGSESMDEGNGFVGAGIAEILNLPLVTAVTRIDISADTNAATVYRRLNSGDREIVECPLPAVFTVETVLCQPIYPPLRTILAGLEKEITRIDAKAMGVEVRDIEPTLAPLGISQLKPRLKKTATIDSSLPPAERMKLIASGGVHQKSPKTIEKPPQEAAAEIIQFLIDNGIVSKGKELT